MDKEETLLREFWERNIFYSYGVPYAEFRDLCIQVKNLANKCKIEISLIDVAKLITQALIAHGDWDPDYVLDILEEYFSFIYEEKKALEEFKDLFEKGDLDKVETKLEALAKEVQLLLAKASRHGFYLGIVRDQILQINKELTLLREELAYVRNALKEVQWEQGYKPYCPRCGSEDYEIVKTIRFKKSVAYILRCKKCGYEFAYQAKRYI